MQTSECIAYIKCKQPETWLIKKAKVQTVTVPSNSTNFHSLFENVNISV